MNALKKSLAPHSLKVVAYNKLSKNSARGCGGIILSGGHTIFVEGNDAALAKEVQLIETAEVPVLGICYGFELLAHMLGAKLVEMPQVSKGVLEIEVKRENVLFGDLSRVDVFENHRFVVVAPVPAMTVLASSKDGVEAFQYGDRQVYGVQFHPEMFVEKTHGQKILDNFLSVCEAV